MLIFKSLYKFCIALPIFIKLLLFAETSYYPVGSTQSCRPGLYVPNEPTTTTMAPPPTTTRDWTGPPGPQGPVVSKELGYNPNGKMRPRKAPKPQSQSEPCHHTLKLKHSK